MKHDLTPSTNEQPSKTIDQAPEQERTFVYDPTRVPQITTQELSDLEARRYDEGVSAAQGQEMIYRLLEQKGVRPFDVQDDALVVDVVGADGKRDRRAMRVDYSGFGSHVNNVKLVEEGTEINPEEVQEAEVEQDRTLESIVGSLRATVGDIEKKMMDAADGAKERNPMIDDAINRIRAEVAGLRPDGSIINAPALRELVQAVLPDLGKDLGEVATESNKERLALVGFSGNELEDAYTRKRTLDTDRRVELDARLTATGSTLADLKLNRTRLGGEADDALSTVHEIAFAVEGLLTDTADRRQYYVDKLGRLLTTLDSHVSQTRTLASDAPRLLGEIRRSLT